MPAAPPDAAVARFREDLAQFVAPAKAGAAATLKLQAGPRLHEGDAFPLGLCVSGGADSLALLLLAHAALPNVAAATVDHGLRPESVDEARYVSEICAARGIPHSILTLGGRPEGNLQDWARRERYRVLGDWAETAGIAALATAHHADDQLETMLMRLNRGSGVGGLAGIRARNGRIVRPLLGWRKSELETIVAACGIVAVDDPANRDDRFDRARLRKSLTGADWLDPVAASRSANALGDAAEALEWAANRLASETIRAENGAIFADFRALPAELIRRLTLICLQRIAPSAAPRGDELDRLIATLERGERTTLANVRCEGGDRWRFSPAPPRRKN